jgi:hypothetical protein
LRDSRIVQKNARVKNTGLVKKYLPLKIRVMGQALSNAFYLQLNERAAVIGEDLHLHGELVAAVINEASLKDAKRFDASIIDLSVDSGAETAPHDNRFSGSLALSTKADAFSAGGVFAFRGEISTRDSRKD